MQKPEPERLAYIDELGLTYDDPVAGIQSLAQVASMIAGTPIALVTVVGSDQQHFIANVGLTDMDTTPKEASFCAHTLQDDPLLVVPDATEDARFRENPLVTGSPHIRAYAGHAIEPDEGIRLGALCVIDHRPRQFEPHVLRQLAALSRAASALVTGYRDRQTLLLYLEGEHQARKIAQDVADRDTLTDLLNQTAFRRQVAAELEKAGPTQALALIDVDHFKFINDHHGHTFGDQFLINVSKVISSTLGPDAIVSRIGGDEFAAFLPPQSQTDCDHRIEAMRLRLRRTALELGQAQLGRVSIGLSETPSEGKVSYETLYQQADIALCAAKDTGRNRALFYSKELDSLYNIRAQRAAFASALAQGNIEPFFQPKIDFASGQIVSFELLARWRDPDRGVIEPAAFSKILTDRAAAPELTYHMIQGAIAAQNDWRARGAKAVRFAINLTIHDLSDPQFVDDLDWRIREAGLDWSDFTFEVTETVIMGNPDGEVYRSMQRIRSNGSEVSLDDFGTGFAGLAHLRDWPIDSVKIDREFVRGMGSNKKDELIVATIISLAHRLDLEVVAEGIETQDVAQRLMQLGCDRGQGYHFSRPVDAETALAELLTNAQSIQEAG